MDFYKYTDIFKKRHAQIVRIYKTLSVKMKALVSKQQYPALL